MIHDSSQFNSIYNVIRVFVVMTEFHVAVQLLWGTSAADSSSASSLFGRRVDWKRAKLPECHCPSSHSTPPLTPSLPFPSAHFHITVPAAAQNFDIRSHK